MIFKKFGKISRLSRDIVITEKLDGTNAQVLIINGEQLEIELNLDYEKNTDFFENYVLFTTAPNNSIAYDAKNLYMFAGSRNRWLDCSSNGDNYGFAKWVKANAEELIKLGEGRHFGEWYGYGIQRGYGLEEKRFALFNVGKWASRNVLINNILCERNELTEDDKRTLVPKCCKVVPILYEGTFDTNVIDDVLDGLRQDGSIAVPGYMKPEGLVVYHKTSGQLFKKTIENDEKPKSIK